MRRLAYLWIVGLLSACAGSHPHAEIGNPYVEETRQFTQTGMSAMQREHWAYAQSSFARALATAQLTDDSRLVAQSWYNLGMARKSGGKVKAAAEGFQGALKAAREGGDDLMALRARLALALLQRQARWYPDAIKASLPPDIHLSAARLAERQQRLAAAQSEYRQALKRSGKTRQGMIYKGQAHLGLGMLAQQRGDGEMARLHMRQALVIFRKVGVPRLIAYTLLQLSKSDLSREVRETEIRHALTIYRAMSDDAGQKSCIEALGRTGFTE